MRRFRQPVIEWAAERDDIRAVIIVGSAARRDYPADPFSDFDLIVYTTGWAGYVADRAWLERFGTLWVAVVNWIGPRHEPEFLAVYDGGDKLDVAFFAVEALAAMVAARQLDEVLIRGYEVLVDKDGLAARLPDPPDSLPPVNPPAREQFAAHVDQFWYDAIYVAKQLKRREPWPAKVRDWAMKRQLLTLIEWHTRATHGWDVDTWYDGKFILDWADVATLRELSACFGHFDAWDSWRALIAMMDLFRRLATDIAARLGYQYPAQMDASVTRYVVGLRVGE